MFRNAVVAAFVALLGACTEPNPNAQGATAEGDSSGEASTTVTATASSTMPGTMTSDATSQATAEPTGPDTGASTCDDASHTCVAAVPEGWDGPAAIIDNPASEREPECAGEYPVFAAVGFEGLAAAPATCDCDCTLSANAACANAVLHHDDNSDCGSLSAATAVTNDASCLDMPAALEVTIGDYWVGESVVSSGSCVPSSTQDIPPAGFTERMTLCSAAPGNAEGCDADEQCLSIPSEPFDGRLCIMQAGDLPCPGSPWTERVLAHREIADDRDCSACTCGAPTGGCDGTIELYGQDSCAGPLYGSIPLDGTCTQGGSVATARSFRLTDGDLTPTNPTCPPSISEATGSAEAASPITICCMP